MTPTLPQVGDVRSQSADGRSRNFVTTANQGMVPGALPTAVPPAAPTTIPVASLEATGAPLALPAQPTLNTDTSAALASSESRLATMTKEAEANLAGQQTQRTALENDIMDRFGVLRNEGADRQQAEQRLQPIESNINQLTNSIFEQQNSLRQFDERFNQDLEAYRREVTSNGGTGRRFSGAAARAQQINAMERSNLTSALYTDMAALDLTQRNLDSATKNIDRALTNKYEPIRKDMEMLKFFLDRNDASFTASQKQVAALQMKELDKAEAEIQRAQDTVSAAVMSGYASASDVKQMSDLSGNPQEQRQYAQTIVAKGANDAMTLDRAYKNAQIANVYDTIQSRQDANRQRQLELIGQVQKDEAATQEVKTLATEKALGIQALAEKILNHKALSSAIGPLSSTRVGAVGLSGLSGQRAEFNALVEQLAGQLTLENTKFLKGAMSDKDIGLITAAASRLTAKGVSEQSYKEGVNEIIAASVRAVNTNGLTTEQAVFYGYLTPEEGTALDSQWQGPAQSAPVFDPTKYFNNK